MTDSLKKQLTVHEIAGDELTAEQLHGILRLRVDVFVVEQKCPYSEVDGRDLVPSTRHLWVSGIDGIRSYLRVLAEPGGAHRIGRVCTAPGERGQGLAALLMKAALMDVGEADCVLDSQTYVAEFYARFGFEPEGAEFLEDGIPHVTMRRRG